MMRLLEIGNFDYIEDPADIVPRGATAMILVTESDDARGDLGEGLHLLTQRCKVVGADYEDRLLESMTEWMTGHVGDLEAKADQRVVEAWFLDLRAAWPDIVANMKGPKSP